VITILYLAMYHLGAESSFKRQRGKRLSRPPKKIIDEYLPVFKAKNEKKMRNSENCMKLKFARNFRNRLLKTPFFDLEGFHIVSSLSARQLYYGKFLIFRSGFPSVQRLRQGFSSCLARISISLL